MYQQGGQLTQAQAQQKQMQYQQQQTRMQQQGGQQMNPHIPSMQYTQTNQPSSMQSAIPSSYQQQSASYPSPHTRPQPVQTLAQQAGIVPPSAPAPTPPQSQPPTGPTQHGGASQSAAHTHGQAFRTSFEQFFHGFDAFLTASESGAVSDDALQKMYERYMQLELETDSLALYLEQTETKLRLEIEEPQITLEQLQQQQANYAAFHPRQPPLPPTFALFRAQFGMHAARGAIDPPPQRTPHATTLTSPRPTSSTNLSSTPRTPISSNHLLTPTPTMALTPNQTVPSPSTGTLLTPNSAAILGGTTDSTGASSMEIL